MHFEQVLKRSWIAKLKNAKCDVVQGFEPKFKANKRAL